MKANSLYKSGRILDTVDLENATPFLYQWAKSAYTVDMGIAEKVAPMGTRLHKFLG